jgi:hypothetical protein
VEATELKVVFAGVNPLPKPADAHRRPADAHRRIAAEHVLGKVVLRVRNSSVPARTYV